MEELSLATIIGKAEELMQGDVENLRHALARIRAGKVSPTLLDGVHVDYYGTRTPIAQVANIAVVDARTLSIEPWEKPMLKAIEKAINLSHLGLTPQNDGQLVRISLPILTEQRRNELVKQAQAEAEHAKVAIRNRRRDAMEQLRKLHKNHNTSKDESKDQEQSIQELTDKLIAKIEVIIAEKTKEITTI